MRAGKRKAFVLFLAMGVAIGAMAAEKAPGGEADKIERLIRAVEALRGAKFVRNGKEYDAKAAAAHLRSKWRWKSSSIKTARDFIRIAASASSETGRPYTIRLADGSEVKSADFFAAELGRIEKP